MSDGPHKSLPMRPGWKRVAEYADNPAFTLEDVSEVIVPAVAYDWHKEVSTKLIKCVRDALGEDLLFARDTVVQLENLKRVSSGYPLGSALIDYTIHAVLSGRSGEEALQGAALDSMIDRTARCARQVEEHYLRESTSPRSVQVRARIEEGVLGADLKTLANCCLNSDTRPVHRRTKQDGLDDGVAL